MTTTARRTLGGHRRFTVGIAALAVLGLATAGCSSTSTATGTTAATSGAISAAAVGGGDAKVTIRLSMQQDNVQQNDPGTWAVVQAFEKANPNITVTAEGQPVDQHIQAMNIAAQSNTLPDIFWIYDANAKDMIKAGKILDLAPMLADLKLTAKFPANMIAAFNNGSAQYGVPAGTLVTGLYFNKEILAAHGLSTPVTFADLLHYCTTVSAAGIIPIAQGANQSAYSVWAFLGMLSRFGYQDMYKDILSGSASYDNPTFLKFYNHIQEMQKANCFPTNVSTQTFDQAVASFVSGKAGMLDSGAWSSAAIDKSNLAGKVGFWPGPTFADGVGDQHLIINVASAPFAVSAAVKSDPARYQAVEKFLGFYYSDAGQSLIVKSGNTPATKVKVTVDEKTQPTFAAVLAAVAAPGYTSPQAQPDLVVPTAVANAMYDSIYGVIQGVTSPQDALQLVQKAFVAAR